MEQLLNNTPIDWVQVTDPNGNVHYSPSSFIYPLKGEETYADISEINVANTIISASVFTGTPDFPPYIEFFKGDGSTFTSSLNVFASTSSYALYAENSTFALTASYIDGGSF